MTTAELIAIHQAELGQLSIDILESTDQLQKKQERRSELRFILGTLQAVQQQVESSGPTAAPLPVDTSPQRPPAPAQPAT